MNIFDAKPQEKGVREWKSVGSILREKRADSYPSGKQKVVHLRIRQSASYHQQFFILKNAH